jgi:hypothetical protein
MSSLTQGGNGPAPLTQAPGLAYITYLEIALLCGEGDESRSPPRSGGDDDADASSSSEECQRKFRASGASLGRPQCINEQCTQRALSG